jgi:Mrp family chromosome partitioning ATPase
MRRVVAVASGKGGVGKSTLSLNLALGLAEQGHRVGLLDADLHGPDIPLMVGLRRQERLRSWDLWRASGPVRLEPVERFGLRIMSVGFLLGEEQALVVCLGRVPMDAAVASAGDTGRPLLLARPESPTAQALRGIAGRVAAALDSGTGE